MGLKNWFRRWKNRRTQPIRNARTLPRNRRERLLFERLEDRLAPAATITSGPTGITIVVPNTETAVVTLAGSNYQITDSSGIDPGSTGGTIVTNGAGPSQTFTATDPASGQTAFTINDGANTGTVQLFAGSANIIPQTTTVTVLSGTFDLNGDNDAIDALNGSGVVTNNSGGSTSILQIGSNGTSGEFDGTIQNGIALTLAGTGATEILTGANTYSGLTTIDSPSTLQIGNGIASTGSLGTGNVNDAGFLTYDLVNTTVFVANNITGGGVLTVNSSTETVVLTGTGNTYSGGTNILSSATLQIGDTLSNGSIGNGQIDDEGSLVFQPQNSITVPATITTLNNTGSVAQNGVAGTSVVLTGGTSWNGSTSINAGTLQFGNSTFGSTTLLTTSILDNGTLAFKLNNGITVPAPITGNGGLTQAGTGTVFLTNNNNLYTGGTNIQSGTVQAGSGAGGGSGSLGAGNVTGQAAGSLVFDLNTNYTFGYGIANIGSVTQEGNDTVIFDGTPVNSYVLTNIAAGSTLQIGVNGSHGSLGSGTVADAGSLIFDRSDQITVANNINGSGGSVTQEGDGTVTLTGTDTYTGSTIVSAAVVGHNSTLLVNAPGSITSNVSVPAGGTLGGTGTITGSVAVSGGTLQPGTANPGILTTGTLNLTSGIYTAVLGGSSAGNGAAFYNQDTVSGASSTITINTNVTLNLTAFNGFTPAPAQQFTIINNTGSAAVTGHFNGLPEGSLISNNFLGSGLAAYITYQGGPNGNSVVIIVAGPVSATGSNLIVRQNSGDLQVFNGAALILSQPLGSVTSLSLNGVNGAANTVTFDFTGGQVVIPGGITYTGGTLGSGSTNSLSIVGGTFNTDTYSYTSQHNGTVQLGVGGQLITFSNLTPISNTGTVTNIVFDLPATNTNATLQDDGTAGNGLSELVSNNATFENTTFNDPTASLTIQAAGGTTNTIATGALPDFNAALTINGNNATDTVNLGALTLGNSGGNTGNLVVGAHTINVTGAIDTSQGTAGNVALTAGGAVSLGAGINTTTTGTVSLTAGAGVSQTAGAVTTSNLQLTGVGAFSLLQPGNHVSSVIAASVTGPLSYTDGGATTVGNVTTIGINTHGNNLVLNTASGLTLESNVTAAGATVTLNSGGGVSQNLGTISSGSLLLTGTGAFALTDNNTVGTVAANVVGAIQLDDVSALTVGTVGATSGIVTGGNNLSIIASGTLALNRAINVGAGTAALESAANAITDGNGANTEVTALDLALEASSGIGTVAAPIVTAVSGLVAESITNGIFVNNTGALTVGFTNDLGVLGFRGVQDTTSGDIVLNNAGSVTITTSGEFVLSKNGNITINATGAGANITTGGNQNAVNITSFNNAYTATLEASGNLVLGTAGKFGNVFGGGSVVLTAGANITLDEGSRAQAFSTGSVIAQAGGDISLKQTTVAGSFIGTSGGAVTLTTGAGKTFTAASGAGGGDVQSFGGNITINADNVSLQDSPSLVAGSGIVTIAPVTAGRIINLGTAAAGQLGLTDTELGRISTTSVLRIGKLTDTANINVTAAIGATAASYNQSLSLLTGGQITQSAGDTITETNLQAQGGGGVLLASAPNPVANLAGAATTAGAQFSFAEAISPASLTVGTVDNLTGITTNNGNITLFADAMSLGAAVNGGTAIVQLDNEQFATTINIGSIVGGDLNLQQSDLNNVTAGVLRIGSLPDTGGLTFSGSIVAPAGWSTLDLITGSGGIIDNNGSNTDITVANLAMQSEGGISLDTAVAQLDFANSVSGNVNIRNIGGVTVTTVDGVAGTGNTAGTTFLSASSPITFAVNTTSAGDLTAIANEAASEVGNPPEDDITVNSGITVSSSGGSVTLTAGDSIILQSGSTVSAANAVNLTAGSGDTDNDASMTLNGSITATDITIVTPSSLVIGTLTASDTISLTATGSITEGLPDPAGPDISATNLSLDATTGIGGSTGVGIGADPELETNVSNLVAFTNTGGIFITNTGDLNIGGFVSEPFAGVTANTSGDIVLTSTNGGIFVNNNGEFISGQGNVTLTAKGDVQADGGNGISGGGIVTVMAGGNVQTGGNVITAIGGGGNVSITAAVSIFAGDAITGGGPITSFGGDIQLTATTGDIVVDGDTFIDVTSGMGGITANAAGNITMQDAGLFGPQFSTQGGTINLTTGAGGTFTAITGVLSTDAVFSNGGNISINADAMSFGAGIDAGTGSVTLDTVTKTIGINLGTVIGGDLNLQQTDLNEVTAGALRIGNNNVLNPDTGGLTVSAAINAPSGTPGTWNVLDLENKGSVTDNGGAGSLTVPDLALQGGSGVSFTNTGNAINALAGVTTNQNFTFVNSAALTVGTVDGVPGIQAGSGSVSLTALTGTLDINQAVAGSGAPVGIALTADSMSFTAALNAGASIVALDTETSATVGINLGTVIGGDLNLQQTDLNHVTAGVLRIGNFVTDSAGLTVSAAITAPAGWSVLDLANAGSVTDGVGHAGSLTVGSLALQGAGGVDFENTANSVANLAGATTNNNFTFVNTGPLTISTVDGVPGIQAGMGAVSITLDAGSLLTVSRPVAGSGDITLQADAMDINAAVNGGAGLVILERVTGSEGITVGTKPGGTLGLTQADLNHISTTAALIIGNFFTATGPLTVTAPITSVGTGWTTLALSTGGTVAQTPGSNLTVPSLNVFGGSGVTLTNAGNSVSNLTGGTDSSSSFSFVDSANLVVGGIPSLFPSDLETSGGTVNVTLAAGKALTVSTTIDTTLGGTTPAGANITLTADNMTLSAPVNGGTGGIVTLTTAAAGQIINLGGSNSVTQLGLTDAELTEVTGAGLVIGDTTNNTGGIVVSAAGIGSGSAAGYNNTLTLETLGTVTETGPGSLSVPTLKVIGGKGVTLGNVANAVSTLTGGTISAGAGFTFVDSESLAVGAPAGIITNVGPIMLSVPATDSLTVNGAIDTTNGGGNSAGANISLAADAMTFSAAINGGTSGTVTLAAVSQGIDLGADSGSGRLVLAVPTASLSEIIASVLKIVTNAGNLFVQGNVVVPASITTLSLSAGNVYGIVESSGTITATNLDLQAAAGIGDGNAILVMGPAVNVPINVGFDNGTGNVQITSSGSGGMNIVAYPGLGKSVNNGANVILTADSPITFSANTQSAGDIDATTMETVGPESGPEDDITVNSGVTVESTGGNVNFTAGDSITIQAGSTVKSDSGTVSLQAGVGDDDNDATLTIDGTISAANLTIVTPGNFLVTSLNVSGTLSITAGGSILDDDSSGPSGLDITANTLFLNAQTGIGGSTGVGIGADPELETQVSNLEAVTGSGGIYITNGVTTPTTLTIVGNGFGPPDGVVVTGNGSIQLINNGSIDVVNTDDVIRTDGIGNVTVEALGLNADVQTGGQVGFNAIRSAGTGNTFVSAGRDILIGNGAGFGSIVSANGSDTVDAGRDVIVDSGSRIADDNTGGTSSSDVTVTAGRNITVQQVNGTGAFISNQGSGNISLTTGVGGVFTLDSGAGGSVTANGGNITISADDMVINDPIDASNGGAASPGIVTLEQATTTTQNIDVGGGTTPGELGLSDTELGQVTASVLRIGRLDNPGNITVTDPGISVHAGFDTLDLLSGGAITQADGGATIAVNKLALQAAGGVGQLLGILNAVNTLAGAVTGSGNLFFFTNGNNLAIGSVDGINGITTNDGLLGVAIVGTLTVTNTPAAIDVGSTGGDILLAANSFVNSGSGVAGASINSGGGDILVAADNMALQAGSTINSGAGRTTLRENAPGTLINVGGADAVGTLGLTAAEINTVTAATLQIGDANAGNMTVSAHIAPTGTNTLDLESGGSISDGGAADTVQVANLALRAANGINLDTVVTNLGFSNTGGTVAIRNTGGLTINNVDGLTASSNTGTTTTLTAGSPVTFAVDTSSASDLTATAKQSAAKTGDDITVDSGVTVESTGGNVTFNAAGNINLQATSLVEAPTGTVNLTAGFAPADTGVLTLSLAGTVAGVTVNLRDNAGPITTNSLTGVINATNLSLFATTGVGSLANPIETNVSAVVAQTATGGIFINNNAPPAAPATLTVGYAGDPFQGVTDTGASGNISLTNAGSIDINFGLNEVVAGPGSVSVTANGNAADITTGTLNNFLNPNPLLRGSIVSTGGTVTVQAGNDLILGDPAQPAYGNIEGGGSVVLSAGSDIEISSDSFIDAHGAGTVTATAGGDISLLNTGLPQARITSQGGAITLTAGSSGTFTADAGGIGVNSTQAGGNGNITINAADIVLDDPITAGTGTIVLNATASGVSQAAPSTVTGGMLALTGSGNFTLTQPGNNVGTLAANITGSGTLSYVNSGALIVGVVGPTSGITSPGSVSLTVGTTLTVSQAISAGSGSVTFVQNGAGGLIDLAASVGGSGGVTVNDAASAANNSLLVDFANGAALPNGLTYTGGTGTNAITVNDAGTNVAHTYNVSATSVSRDGAVIAYTSVANLTVNGGNLGDTFNVTPSQNTAYTLNGNLPTSNPNGDTLNFDGQNLGLTATINVGAGGNGSIGLTGGYKTINFTSIENFAVSDVAIQVQDFADAEVLNVYASNANSGFYQFGNIGGGQPQIFFSNITSFDYLGDADADVLDIYNPPNSFVTPAGGVKLFAPINGISFEAGGGGSLNIIGGQEITATYTYNPRNITGNSGTIELDGLGGLTANYTYSGLSPLTNSGGVSNIIFKLPSGIDNQASPSSGGSGMTVLSSASNNFENTTVSDPTTNLTVDEGAGAQTITLDTLDNTFSANIAVNGGTGPTTFNVQATPAGTTTTYTGGGSADTINVGSTAPVVSGGTLAGIQGALTLTNTAGGSNSVIADDSGDLFQEANATLTDLAGFGVLSGLGNGAPISYDLNFTSSLVVKGTNNGDTFLINQTAPAGIASKTTINTGTGSDQVSIRATSLGTAYDIQGQGLGDTVDIGSQAPNTTTGNLLGIAGSVTVENNGALLNGALTTINIDDSADPTVGGQNATLDTVAIGPKTFDRLSGLGNAGAIQWAVNDAFGDNETQMVTINGGPQGNTFTVNQLLGVGVHGGAITVDLNTGTGTDKTFIEATNGAPLPSGQATGVLNVQGQNAADTVDIGSNAAAGNTNGTLANIVGEITVANSGGATAINIDDSGDASPKSATIDTFVNMNAGPTFDQTFEQLINLGNAGTIAWNINDGNNHDGTGLVTINGGTGGNTFLVDETDTPGVNSSLAVLLNSGTGKDTVNVQATNAPLTVQGQAGADTVNVSSLAGLATSGGTLANIDGPVTIANSSAFTKVNIDDSGDGIARTTATLDTVISGVPSQTYDRLTGLGNPAPITWDVSDAGGFNDIGPVTIKGGSQGNTYLVNQTAAAGNAAFGNLSVTLDSNGVDTVNIQATNAPFTVQGQNGADLVNIGSNAQTTNTNGNLAGIQGSVTVANSGGMSTINIDDSGDNTAAGQNARLDTFTSGGQSYDRLTGLGMAPFPINIAWDIKDAAGHNDISTVTINGGPLGNNIVVDQTILPGGPTSPVIDLNTGLGNDVTNVQATNAMLNIQGESGIDAVNIGNAGTVQGILGTVNIENTGSFTHMNVDDSADGAARTVTLSTFAPNPSDSEHNNDAYGQISGLTPNSATINYELDDTTDVPGASGLTINGGALGNTFIVNQTLPSTSPFTTTLNTGTGIDHVNVEATSANVSYVIQGQGGNDSVNIGIPSATLAGIQGSVTVENQGASFATYTSLTIDDSGDTTGRSATIGTATNLPNSTDTFGTLTGLGLPAGVKIAWDLNDASGNTDVQSVTVKGGSGGNTFLVNQTNSIGAQFGFLFLDSGTGNDTVNVQGVSAGSVVDIQGQQGTDTVNVGSKAGVAPTGGTLANIQGSVFAYNQNGSTTLNIDDSGSASATAYGIQDLPGAVFLSPVPFASGPVVSFTSPTASIYWNSGGTGVAGVNINGAAGANTFGIDMTAPSSAPYTVTVNTGTGAATKTVNIDGTTAGTTLVIEGQGGADDVNLGAVTHTVQGLLGTVDIQNSGGTSVIVADDSADTVAQTVFLISGQISGLAPANINYGFADVTSLTVMGGTPTLANTFNTFNVDATPANATTTIDAGKNGDTFNIQGSGLGAGSTDIFNGGTGDDTFNVSPSTSATIQINGNAPFVAPGDNLNITGGTGVSIIPSPGEGNGTVTFTGGSNPITFTSIEGFNISNSSITVIDTTDAEILNVYASNHNSGYYQFAGAGQPQIFFNGALSFTYAGDNDGDTLNVFNPPNGFIAPTNSDTLFAPAGGITFTGGLGGSLNIIGGSESSATYAFQPDGPPGTHNGTIDLISGALDAHYVYAGPNAGATPITNTGTVTDVTLDLPQGDGDNQALLESGGGAATELASGNSTFANTKFTDPSHSLTLNAGNDGETVTLAALDNTFAAALALNGGTGNDTFNIQATPALAATSVLGGGGNDTVNVGNPHTVAQIAGTLTIDNPGGTAAVTVDDSADAANEPNIQLRTVLLNAEPFGQVSGLGAGVANINYSLDDTSTFTLEVGTGTDTVKVNQTLAANVAGNSAVIVGGTKTNTVNIQNTSGGVTYDIQTTAAAPAVNVGLPGAAGTVQGINGTVDIENTGGGLNAITVNDVGDTTGHNVTMSTVSGIFAQAGGQISGLAPVDINYDYADTKSLTIDGGTGGNTLNVQATGAGFTTQLNTGVGNDTVNIGSSADKLDDIAGILSVNGQGNAAAPLNAAQQVVCMTPPGITLVNPVGDTINFNDQGNIVAASYTLNAGSLIRTGGASTSAEIDFSNVETLHLTAGTTAGPATNVDITGTANNSSTTVNTTAGTAVVAVASTGAASVLDVNAGAPDNNVTVQSTGTGSIVAVTGNTGSNTMTVLNTGANAGVHLDSGTGTDTMNVEGAGVGSLIQISGSGTNTVNIGSNPANPAASTLDPILSSEICVTATTLNIDDAGSNAVHTYTVTDVGVQRDSGTLIENMGVGSMVLNGGSAANTYTIENTTSGTTTSINAGGGNDSVSILATGDALIFNGQGGNDTVSVTNGGSVQGISGTVNLEDPNGAMALTVDDSVDTNTLTVAMSTLPTDPTDSDLNLDPYGQISGLAPAAINYEYQDTASLTVLTGPGGLFGDVTVNVLATGILHGNPATPTNLIANGPTTINVGGDPDVGAQNILGPLDLQNSAGADNVITVDDSNNTAPQNIVLDTVGGNGTITGMSPGVITYALSGTSLSSQLTLLGGSGGNTFTVTNVQVPVLITGGSGNDTVIGPDQNDIWSIPDTALDINSGTMSPTTFPFAVDFTNIANLTGGSMEDVFQFNEGAQITGVIDGGGGRNWLDYSGIVTTFVDVNLTAGTADGTGGVANIQNVIGSAFGGDTIVGGPAGGILSTHDAGNTLIAGTGPTILVGGYGRNMIKGGPSSDILINGRTTYDPDQAGNPLSVYARLDLIFQEWTNGAPYKTRVKTLKSTAFSDPLIYGTTVKAFPGINGGIGPRFGRGGGKYDSTLIGGPGLDWFFTYHAIDVVDPQKGEIITDQASPDPAPVLSTYSSHTGSLVVNLTGTDSGAAPAAVSGIASLYTAKTWTRTEPIFKGVTFSYDTTSNDLTVAWPTSFLGTFRVFLWDSQGQLFKTFLVNSVKDRPPTISTVSNQTVSHAKSTLTIKDVKIADPYHSPVTITAMVTGYGSGKTWTTTTADPPGFAVSYDPVHKELLITKPTGFKGTFQVTITVSDGIASTQKSFKVKVK